MDIYLKELKQNEQVALIKLHAIVRQGLHVPTTTLPDAALYRFLKANDLNVDKAADQVRESAAWRQAFDWKQVSYQSQDVINVMFSAAKFGYYGEDSKGRPIRYLVPQKAQVNEIFKTLGPHNIFHFQLGMLERLTNIVLERCSQKYNRHVHQIITIVDVKELEVSKILTSGDMISFIKNNGPEFQRHYPELTYRAVIINAGPVFYTLWKVVSVFFKETTLKKIKICNENYLPELLEVISLDKIPQSYGGTSPYEIDNYPNFFDTELYQSFQEHRLTLK